MHGGFDKKSSTMIFSSVSPAIDEIHLRPLVN